MKIVVVIPTYNEALNIGHMIPAVEEVFKQMPNHEMHLLVVDGNSPDGTGNIVSAAAEKNPRIHLLTESKKNGLGAAYFYGFAHCINNLNADAVVEMDADFQHDPKDIPRLIEPLNRGYDYVLGSRFMRGGSIPKEWALYRKFLSIGGNMFSKIVLGIYDVDDFTTGFKATRVKGFLDKINFSEIKTKGFAYKLELLYRIHKLGAKIIQVPIKFGLRDRGDSKMESDNFFDSLTLVVKLRLNEKKEFLRFCVVGGAGFITDAGIFNILSFYMGNPKVAALVSGTIAMLVTFTLNNQWSFRTRKMSVLSQQLKTLPVYIAFSILPILVRSKLVSYAIALFGKSFLVYNSAFLVGVALGLIWNYVIYSKIIWKKPKLI